MRHPVLSLVIAVGLSAIACSEQPTETQQDSLAPQQPSFVTAASCLSASAINTQITTLFPAGPLRQSALSQFKSIPPKTNKPTGTAARDKVFAFIGFVLNNYYAGKLIGGLLGTTQTKVLDLIAAVDCYSGVAPQTIPPGALDPDGAAAVITPTSPLTTVETGTKHAGVQVPTGAVSQPVLVTITRLPDSPGPLLTSLDQFPLFYEFSVSPNVTFNLNVLGGICLRDNVENASALRLAHNVGTSFGQVEILPLAAAGFLDCSTLDNIGSLGGTGWNHFAWAKALLLPAELHASATTLLTTAVGGTMKKFSPFGAVDPGSNPGSFTPVSLTVTSEPVGTTVTRTVHVASQDGTLIAHVPVTFSTTTGTLAGPEPVLTDASGNASVSWTLPSEPGVFTLTATVPAIDNPPTGTSAPPGGNTASFPDVAFDQSQITFTVAGSSDGELTPLPCSLEGSIRSLNADRAVDVTFTNLTTQNVSVYWLDYNGQRDFPFGGGIGFPYNVLAPQGDEGGGDSYVQGTFVTHPWLLIGADETCYGIFLPLSPSEGTYGGTATVGSVVIP
jgi:hypothetical protein